MDAPLAALLPDQGGVLPGHGGQVQPQVGQGGPAQDIFPVPDGQRAAPGQGQLAPDLSGGRDAQQPPDGPDEDEQGQQGEEKPGDPGVQPDQVAVGLDPLGYLGAQDVGLGKGTEQGVPQGVEFFGQRKDLLSQRTGNDRTGYHETPKSTRGRKNGKGKGPSRSEE